MQNLLKLYKRKERLIITDNNTLEMRNLPKHKRNKDSHWCQQNTRNAKSLQIIQKKRKTHNNCQQHTRNAKSPQAQKEIKTLIGVNSTLEMRNLFKLYKRKEKLATTLQKCEISPSTKEIKTLIGVNSTLEMQNLLKLYKRKERLIITGNNTLEMQNLPKHKKK